LIPHEEWPLSFSKCNPETWAVRLILLQTDNVLPQFQVTFGDYPGMFSELLSAPEIDLDVVDVREGVPADGAADAYVITGSRHSVYDDLPWIRRLARFLEVEIIAGRKVVAVCFGHQLLAHFLGGEVRPAPVGWEVGVKETEICVDASWMEPAKDRINLISSHKDQVVRLPPEAEVLAHSPGCPVAGFRLGKNVITFQGHPEFNKDYARALMNYRREILGESVHAAGLDSLNKPTDESLVGRWILRFLQS
jgi:GMP synthase-like glutamine amidotransferase